MRFRSATRFCAIVSTNRCIGHRTPPARLELAFVVTTERFENIFRQQRDRIESNFKRVFHGVDDRRRRTIHGKLADSFRAKRPVNISQFFEEHANRRQVGGSRHDVVRHLAVLHAPILPNHFLVQRISDSLRDAARDLPAGQNRMQDLAHFLQRDKVVHGHAVGRQINRHFGDINRPGKRRVGLAAILFIVPENIVRRFVTRPRAERSVRRNMILARGAKFLRGI